MTECLRSLESGAYDILARVSQIFYIFTEHFLHLHERFAHLYQGFTTLPLRHLHVAWNTAFFSIYDYYQGEV